MDASAAAAQLLAKDPPSLSMVEDEVDAGEEEFSGGATEEFAPGGESIGDFAAEVSDSPFSIRYFSILYGPSVRNPTSFQPTPEGLPDRDRPVLVKNHLTMGYDVSERLLIAGTLPFTWVPVQGQRFEVRDPYLRVGLDHLLRTDLLNYYADLRVHFPVTKDSRNQDMLASVQTFHVLTVTPGTRSNLSLDLFTSARANFFGDQGFGTDLELYLAPELSYQMTPTVGLTILYEMGASHWFGDKPWLFRSDGTDLEPGISWDVSPSFNVHPYMNIFPSGSVSWDSTSVGLMLNWKLL